MLHVLRATGAAAMLQAAESCRQHNSACPHLCELKRGRLLHGAVRCSSCQRSLSSSRRRPPLLLAAPALPRLQAQLRDVQQLTRPWGAQAWPKRRPTAN